MNQRYWGNTLSKLLLAIVCSVAATTTTSKAEQLTELPQTERQKWRAVGLVVSEGLEVGTLCSGTLVAPDLVLTAAHCVDHESGLLQGVQFIAGQDGSRRAATSGVVEVSRYPVWEHASGDNKWRFDLAVLTLSRPISPSKVAQIAVIKAQDDLPELGSLLGYQNGKTKVLHGQRDCSLSRLPREIGLLTSNCAVASGNSGGPLLVNVGGKWLLAGVIVAKSDANGASILVEVNDWVRRKAHEAEKRHLLRSGSTITEASN